DLDRDRNVTFDLFGRLTGVLRNDVDERWHRIWVGLDVELDEARNADAEHENEQQRHQHSLPQGKGDYRVHRGAPRLVAAGGAIDKQRAAGHELFADGQAFDNFDQAISNLSDADGTGGNRAILTGYPNVRRVTLINDSVLWDGRSGRRLTGDDAKIGEHPWF